MTEKKSPLSAPLNKVELPTQSAKSSSDSYPTTFEKTAPAEAGSAFSFLKILLAMFLFPFFFQIGTELYGLARTQIMGAQKGSANQKAQGGSGGTDAAVLEKLSQILANQARLMEEGGKVVIIHPALPGQFAFDAEKTKLYELSGINLDDPVSGVNKLAQTKSVELLYSVMESCDRVVLNAAASNISEFHVKNAIEWKKRAIKRLQDLR